jgi:acetyltransferase-like isoleucine patch superfamily enzyme
VQGVGEQHPGAQVAPEARLGADVEIAPGAVVHEGVELGAGSRVGSGAVLHAGSKLGDGCLIEDGAILGKRPRLRPGSSAAGGKLGPLELGGQVTVCCGAVLYAGTVIGDGAIIGDQAQVRERASVGPRSVVGRGSCVDFDAAVGADVLIQTGVYVTGGSVVEDDVFLGPGVVTTNDHSMGRHPRNARLQPPVFRRACRIGGGVTLVPGVEIGEEAFVAAGALVTRDVAAREVVMGAPARAVRHVDNDDLIERWRDE